MAAPTVDDEGDHEASARRARHVLARLIKFSRQGVLRGPTSPDDPGPACPGLAPKDRHRYP